MAPTPTAVEYCSIGHSSFPSASAFNTIHSATAKLQAVPPAPRACACRPRKLFERVRACQPGRPCRPTPLSAVCAAEPSPARRPDPRGSRQKPTTRCTGTSETLQSPISNTLHMLATPTAHTTLLLAYIPFETAVLYAGCRYFSILCTELGIFPPVGRHRRRFFVVSCMRARRTGRPPPPLFCSLFTAVTISIPTPPSASTVVKKNE